MLILEKFIENWDPKIGDPTPVGWLTVAAYLLTAGLLIYHLWKSPEIYRQNLRQHATILTVAFLVMAFLGANKQLDLQSLFTAVGRDVAREQGWYEIRRTYQYLFIALLLLVSVLGVAGLLVGLRRIIGEHRLLVIGLVFIVVFVLVRATSFHMMDTLIGSSLGGIQMNWLLELGGITIVAIGSAYSILRGMLLRL